MFLVTSKGDKLSSTATVSVKAESDEAHYEDRLIGAIGQMHPLTEAALKQIKEAHSGG